MVSTTEDPKTTPPQYPAALSGPTPKEARDQAIQESRRIQSKEGAMAARQFLAGLSAELASQAIESWNYLSEYESYIEAAKHSSEMEFGNMDYLRSKLRELHGPYTEGGSMGGAGGFLSTANLDLDDSGQARHEKRFRQNLASALDPSEPRESFKQAMRLCTKLSGADDAARIASSWAG